MRRPTLIVLFALSLVLALPLTAGADVGWRSWGAGLEAANSAGKPVLVDVYTDWCGWCKRMDRDVYAQPEVAGYVASHFVTVRLNAESDAPLRWQGRAYTGRSLASQFNVSGYPTTIFLTAKGEHLVNVPGYITKDRFMLLLRYIGDGHMDRGETWDAYSKAAAKGAN